MAAPLLQLAAPPGYAYASVILIADSSAAQELVWVDGLARLDVPRSGVVRLKSLGLVGAGRTEVQLNGKDYWQAGSADLNGAPVATFLFAESHTEPALNALLEVELAQYIREREHEP